MLGSWNCSGLMPAISGTSRSSYENSCSWLGRWAPPHALPGYSESAVFRTGGRRIKVNVDLTTWDGACGHGTGLSASPPASSTPLGQPASTRQPGRDQRARSGLCARQRHGLESLHGLSRCLLDPSPRIHQRPLGCGHHRGPPTRPQTERSDDGVSCMCGRDRPPDLHQPAHPGGRRSCDAPRPSGPRESSSSVRTKPTGYEHSGPSERF